MSHNSPDCLICCRPWARTLTEFEGVKIGQLLNAARQLFFQMIGSLRQKQFKSNEQCWITITISRHARDHFSQFGTYPHPSVTIYLIDSLSMARRYEINESKDRYLW